MESYQQIKERHSAEVNAFPLRSAFSNDQLAEMMKGFGLPNDKSGYAQIAHLGYGVYIKKSDIPAWREMTRRHRQEIATFRKNRTALRDALIHEFHDHESQYSRDDETICACVGLKWEDVQNDKQLSKLYEQAWSIFMKTAVCA